MLAYQRHKRREFWIQLIVKMAEKLNIPYDSLREKEVVEFFYLLKEYERIIKPKEQ